MYLTTSLLLLLSFSFPYVGYVVCYVFMLGCKLRIKVFMKKKCIVCGFFLIVFRDVCFVLYWCLSNVFKVVLLYFCIIVIIIIIFF